LKKNHSFLEYLKAFIYDQTTKRLPISFDAVVMLLYSKDFRKKYNFLKKSQQWTQEQLKIYQEEKLSNFITHAYKNVEYYKRLFDRFDLKPQDISSIEDLQKLPFLTKELVKENFKGLIAKNFPKYKLRYLTTGGSTGTPLGFYVEKGKWDAEEIAFNKIIFDRFGCNFNDKYVLLRGYLSKYKQKEKFWEYSLFGRCLILFPYFMDGKNIPKYIKKIRRFKPKFIITFPSIISILAEFMRKKNLKPFKTVKTIICCSELLYNWQRGLLEDFFQCKIVDIYGHAESAVFAATCEKSNYFHIFPEYGIVELIDKDGKPVTKEGEKGEIVVTGFRNPIFPFIRYRTGDIAINTNHKCECGKNYPLFKKIEGRIQDFVVTKNKKIIPITTGFYGFIAKNTQNVDKVQLNQDSLGILILNIVKGKNYTVDDEVKIKNNFQKKYGNDFNLIIQYVDKIQESRWGRHKFFIQKLPISIEDILN